MKRFCEVRVLETTDLIWLCGEATTQNQKTEIDVCLQQISGAVRFDRLPDGQLIQTGHKLPSCCLPEQPGSAWILLTDWIAFDLPQTSLVGISSETTTIEIVRQPLPKSTDEIREPSILRCSIEAFAAWADRASEHRIRRLSFACNQDAVTESQLLICESNEPLQSIDRDSFVAATRAGIRSTLRQQNSSQEPTS